jgi:hypothetical protein
MPLTLSNNQLWERIKKVQGQQFSLIETGHRIEVVEIFNNKVNLKDLNGGKIRPVPRKEIEDCYDYVKENGKYTSKVWKKDPRISGNSLARIIALLTFAVPDEIAPFTQDQGERLFGERLRGIRKKDC